MKRIIVFATILLVVLSSQVGAIDLGKKLALRLINFPLNPAMDTGVYNAIKWPDSAAVATWVTSGADTGNTTSQVVFGSSTTTVTAAGLAALGIRADTVGAPMFVLCDTLRILNAGTTTRQLTGMVTLWRLGAPFTTQFTVFVCADTLLDEVKTVAGTSQTARDLGAQLDSATSKVGIGDGAIGAAEIATNAIGADELATDAIGSAEIAASANQEIDSGVWHSRVDTITPDSSAGKVLYKNKKIKDTVSLFVDAATSSRGTSTLTTSDNIGINLSDVSGTLDSNEVGQSTYDVIDKNVVSRMFDDTTKKVKFSNDSVIAIDPVRTVVLTTPAPTIKQIRDTIIKSSDTGRIRVDNQGYLFTGNVMQDTTKRVPMKGGSGTDSVRSASFSVSASVSTADKQDISRIVLGDTTKRIFGGLFSDTSKRIGFKGGSGDSVKVVANATATVDTAAIARSVWDNDVVALVNRTATATATVDTAAIARSVWDNDIVARANRTVDGVDTVVLACINGDTVASAGDFLKTGADYRREIKNIFGVSIDNTTWVTDTTLNQLVRQAVVKVNPLMRGVKFKDTVVTNWQQSDYALDSMIGVISVSWQKEDTIRPIVYAPLETWGSLQHQSTWGGDDPYLSRPTVYDVTDNQIMFFPPPTQTDTIEIVGFRKVYGIVTTSDFSAIPQAYRIPVLYYAAFLVAQSKQHPGTDRMLNEYNKAVSDVLMALNRRANAPTDSK